MRELNSSRDISEAKGRRQLLIPSTHYICRDKIFVTIISEKYIIVTKESYMKKISLLNLIEVGEVNGFSS